MIARFALAILVFTASCKDSRHNNASHVEPTGRAALRGATIPTLATPSIDNIDGVPAEARERIENTVLAIVENRTMDFVDTVSTGGFTIGSLALTKAQAEAELAGRTVAELTNVACADHCRWSVSARSETELELEARANGTLVGAVELVHEDDGSWGVAGARPMRP